MNRPFAVFAAAVVFARCTGEPTPDRRGAADSISAAVPAAGVSHRTALVADSTVGCLRVGASLEMVKSSCAGIRDTTIYLEGSAQEAAWVGVRGGRALAEIVGGAVWRINVDDPALMTRDSIGVGTPLSHLAGLPGIRIAYGEGTFAITDAHCGNSFEVEGLPYRRQPWTPSDIGELPDSVRIARILVIGRCRVR